jgi:hypothetical protein
MTSHGASLPFEVGGSGLSPSSKVTSSHKLENKVLVTQIDESADLDDENSVSMHISTFRQSLQSII